MTTGDIEPPHQPITTLRGAGVEVDARRVGRAVVGLCLVALAVTAIVLFVAGLDKNAQINRLRQHGVPVTATVSGCQGLLGGSGSNAAGYACRGTYTVDGRRYSEAIPGDILRRTGSTLRAVVDPSDPALVSTVGDVESQHASWRVFILPAVLVILLALLVGALLLRRRHLGRSSPGGP